MVQVDCVWTLHTKVEIKNSHTTRNPTHQFNVDYNRKANSCGQRDQLIHPWAGLWFGHLLRALSVQIIKKDQRTEAACSLNNCSGAQFDRPFKQDCLHVWRHSLDNRFSTQRGCLTVQTHRHFDFWLSFPFILSLLCTSKSTQHSHMKETRGFQQPTTHNTTKVGHDVEEMFMTSRMGSWWAVFIIMRQMKCFYSISGRTMRFKVIIQLFCKLSSNSPDGESQQGPSTKSSLCGNLSWCYERFCCVAGICVHFGNLQVHFIIFNRCMRCRLFVCFVSSNDWPFLCVLCATDMLKPISLCAVL